MTDQPIEQTTQDVSNTSHAEAVIAKLKDNFNKAYSQFVIEISKIPCHPHHRSLATQFLDTAALWLMCGVERAVTDSLKAPLPPTPAPIAENPAPVADQNDDAA